MGLRVRLFFSTPEEIYYGLLKKLNTFRFNIYVAVSNYFKRANYSLIKVL